MLKRLSRGRGGLYCIGRDERKRERATVEGIRRFSLVQWGFADRSLNSGRRINPRKMCTCPCTIDVRTKSIAKCRLRFARWFYFRQLPIILRRDCVTATRTQRGSLMFFEGKVNTKERLRIHRLRDRQSRTHAHFVNCANRAYASRRRILSAGK